MEIPVFRDDNARAWFIYYVIGTEADALEAATNGAEAMWQSLDEINYAQLIINVDDEPHAYIGIGEIEKILDGQQSVIAGTKSDMGARARKATQQQFHEMMGHLGYQKGCRICEAIARTTRRIYPQTDPYKETRPGFAWVMDSITWSHESDNGERYCYCLRDIATGYPVDIIVVRKSQIADALLEVIKSLRDEYGSDQPHLIVKELHVDPAGEHTGADFQSKLSSAQVVVSLGDERKESMAKAEAAVKMTEIGCKALMLQNSVNVGQWPHCTKQNSFLRQRMPRQIDIKSKDGDCARPRERLSNGRISRRQCNAELKHFITFGTPCRVSTPKTLGSNLEHAARERWGIAWDISSGTPKFKCPFHGHYFRSKDYKEHPLPPGCSYQDFFNMKNESVKVTLPEPFVDSDGMPITGKPDTFEDFESATVADEEELDDIQALELEREIDMLKSKPEYFIGRDVYQRIVQDGVDLGVYHGEVIDTDTNDMDNTKLWGVKWDNGKNTDLDAEEMLKFCIHQRDGDVAIAPSETEGEHSDVHAPTVHAPTINDVRRRMQRLSIKCIYTEDNDTWTTICNRLDLPEARRKIYYQWLIDHHGIGHQKPVDKSLDLVWMKFTNPYGNGNATHFSEGVPFPIPYGEAYDKMLHKNDAEIPGDVRYIYAFANQIDAQMRLRRRLDEQSEIIINDPGNSHCMAANATTMPPMEEWINLPAPESYEQAMNRPDAAMWQHAVDVEHAAFEKLEVMSHNHTRDEYIAQGVADKPVPLKYVFGVKKKPDGSYDKHKCRMVLCGHSGYMIPGVNMHHDTFAPSPDLTTYRLVLALCLILGWKKKVFDIRTAYLQAARDKCSRLALIYPKGQKRFRNGEMLYGILLSNLYGHPEAARNWAATLTEWILSHFNGHNWSVRQCQTDPCCFILLSPENKSAILIVYTDDCAVHGETDDVNDTIQRAFNKRFGVTQCDERFLLGVQRTSFINDDGVECLSLTQPEFCENLAADFAEFLPATAETPFPPSMILGANEPDQPDENEQRKYRGLGYLRAAGSILWAARQCYIECSFAASQLCSIMSKPSEKGFKAAMRTIKWLHVNQDRGILYTATGNIEPIAYYDSAHHQYKDGKAHHGHQINVAGGPVTYESKKHLDPGDSTAYNEYMALFYTANKIVGLRQLISELGPQFAHLIDKPTLALGDNDTATSTAQEIRVTQRTRHFDLKYHYTRNQIMTKTSIRVDRVPTADNVSDLQTKSVSVPVFKLLADRAKGYKLTYVPGIPNL